MPNRRFILAHGFSLGSLGSVALEPVTRQDTIEKVCLQEGSQKGTRETGRAGFPTTPSRHAPSGRYLLRMPNGATAWRSNLYRVGLWGTF